jgi:uncharacterized protein (TIGR03083 family)
MNGLNQPLKPISTANLFTKLEGLLMELLRSLGPDEWEKQTVAPRWKVKDVTAHLLDTQLRKLSVARDKCLLKSPNIKSDADLVDFINRMNEEGVAVYGRLSPNVLISLMESASSQSCEHYKSLDPFAPALFGVSWAGEKVSANWFDTAREFTERWHHQQQIRLAVDKPGIMTPELYYPVLDCFMRALPYAYRNAPGEPGSVAQFNIAGECGGSWYLQRDDENWRLLAAAEGERVSETTIPQEIAWRIFTKGIDRESARAQTRITGDAEIGLHILGMVSIVG